MLSGFYARVQTHVRIVADELPYWRELEESQVREAVEKRRHDVKAHREGPREAASREPTGEEPDARAHKHA